MSRRHKEIQEDLQTSEMRYRRLFETARDGILILDAVTLKIIDANPFMVELSGYRRDEVFGRELWEIGLFKNKAESRTMFRELQATGSIIYEDLRLQAKTGKQSDVEFTGHIYQENERQVIQCNIRDLSGRKNVQEEKEEEQAEKFEILAHIAGKAARLGGWTIDLPERTLAWSDENCAIHDVPPGYKPTLEEGINLFLPDYRDQVIRYVEACAKDGTPYDFELPKYTVKGRLIWVRSIGEAVRDADGKIIRLQGAFQDITLRKQAEAEKENLIKELQNALAEVKALRDFLPICSYCKKVRDDENYWSQIESYISRHTHTKFSHGICPDCYETEVTPQYEKMKQRRLAEGEASEQ